MFYKSTRGGIDTVRSAEVITMGIAPDGGLFVPDEIPHFSIEQIAELADKCYQDKAIDIFRLYLTDYSSHEISHCVYNAYNETKFDTEEIVPLHKLHNNLYCLELWHGPTAAFKDMALQILPHFLTLGTTKVGEKNEIVILVATSGDTGKAALEGFKNVAKVKVIVFFPAEGVSEVQKMQMLTQEGNNVSVVAVNGNFDDAQNGVKQLFTDESFNTKLSNHNLKFSSANSINWGRLLPQIVYYFSAYTDLLKKGEIVLGEKINFVVPTGNFGNILAAYYARQMGLPVNRLICAANENNVLTDFINTGIYNRKRPFKKTISPSMDILISSNLERLLFELTAHDAARVKQWMNELKQNGCYTIDSATLKALQEIFWSDYATEAETLATINDCYQKFRYVIDTHTAVAKNVYAKYAMATGDHTKTVIASTASPFKFNVSVLKAIQGEDAIAGKDEFELLEILADISGLEIPRGLRNLNQKPVLHHVKCNKDEMAAVVQELLGI